MSKNSSSSSSGGIGFVGILSILFIAFKLLGVIDWSWVWVLSPIWIPGLCVIGILAIASIVFIVRELSKK